MTEYPTRIPPNNVPMDDMRTTSPMDRVEEGMQEHVRGTRLGNRTLDMVAATGTPVEEASDTASSEYRTSTFINQTAPSVDASAIVGEAASNGSDPTQVLEEIHNLQGQVVGHETYGDFVLQAYLANGSPEMHGNEINIYRNQQILTEVLQDRFQSWDERTNAGLVYDFLDRYLLTYLPFGLIDDISLRGERNGAEVLSNAATMNADEFRQFAEDWADDRASEGILNDNWFALQDALGEAENNGYSPEARLNQTFAALDALLLVSPVSRLGTRFTTSAAARLSRRLAARGSGAISRASAAGGIEAGDAAAEALIRGGAQAVENVVDDTIPAHLALGRRPDAPVSRISRTGQLLNNNPLLERIRGLYQQGAFGVRATADEIDQEAQRTIQRLNSSFDDPVLDTRVVDPTGLGNETVEVVIGRPVIGIEDGGGLPFREIGPAQSLAYEIGERGLAAEVRAVDPEDLSLGYHVVVSERLDLTRVADPFAVGSISQGLLARALGRAADHTETIDGLGFADLAQLGEAGMNQLSREVEPYIAQIRRLGADERFALDNVFVRIRDGQDSVLNRNYTRQEFNQVWRQEHPTNRAATDADWNAYTSAVTINDTAYALQANRLLQRYVTNGYRAVQFNGFRTPARRVSTELSGDTPVLDVSNNQTLPRGRMNDDLVVWELETPAGDARYVVNPEVRSLEFGDVLSYNSGGRRANPDAHHFVMVGNRAVMTAFSEGAATAARNSLRAIREVFTGTGLRLGDLTDELDGVLLANRSFHHGIENTEDFVSWIRREGLEEAWEDTTLNLEKRARDEVIEGSELDLWNGSTFGDRISQQQSRRTRPLTEVGGGTGRQHSPTSTMVNQLNDVGSEFAFRAATQRAKASWMKRFLGTERLPSGMDVNAAFARAGYPTGKTRNGRELRYLRAQIERRENVKSAVTQNIEEWGNRLREFVFDRTGRRIGGINVNSVQNSILTFGFHSAFGFINLAQFPLQASHVGAIVAISPRQGMRAARDVLPIRLAMNMPEGEMRDQAVRNLARVSDLSEDDIRMYWDYLRSSGRDLIEGDQMEKGTAAGFGISGFTNQNMRPSFLRRQWVRTERTRGVSARVSAAPFNEGERLSRHTAILTAFREFREKFPEVNAMSPQGRAWISRREQLLTFNMTASSRGAWQTGAMRIPTQWLSYSMRAFENILLGRDFDKMERFRMTVWYALSGGLAGMGLHSAVDSIGEHLGIEPGGNADVALRYGLVDGILSYGLSGMTGQEIRTALGTRMSPLLTFTDLYRKITEENAVGAIAGPSGDMIWGFGEALVSSIEGFANGTTSYAMQDLERVLRTPGAINNYFTAAGIINYGTYRGRTGTTLPMEFTDIQGLLTVAGITQYEVAEYYQRRTASYRSSQEIRTYSNRLRTRYREAVQMLSTDREAGLRLMDDVSIMIELSGFSPYDQDVIRGRVFTVDVQNDLVALALEDLQQQNRYGAEVVESLGLRRD